MNAAVLDVLMEALVDEARAYQASRLTLTLELAPGREPLHGVARSFKGDAPVHERVIPASVHDAMIRRTLIGVSLDPWQFRQVQTATRADEWEVSVEGASVPQRQLTFRLFDLPGSGEGASRRVDEALRQLQIPEPEPTPLETGMPPPDEPTIVKLVNLILKDAISKKAQAIRVRDGSVEFKYPSGEKAEVMRPPEHLWPEIRSRILVIGLSPWDRGPSVARFLIRLSDGSEYLWLVEVTRDALMMFLERHTPG